MSGQPYRYNTDIENFRSDYMDRLNLQATIDDMNLKANQVYKASGQLPPQSSMPDTRTTSEKLADTLRLKTSLISELKPIAGPQFAQQVIQEVEKSNLNSNGGLFIFFAQNVKEIVRNLQRKYALGIVGNANDALNFRLFIENMYNQTKELTGSVQSAFNRPYNNKTTNLADIQQVKQIFDELRIKILTKYPYVGREGKELIESIYTIMDAIVQLLPNRDLLKQLNDNILDDPNILGNANPVNRDNMFTVYTDLEQFLTELPLVPSIYTVYDHLKKSLMNDDPDLTVSILGQLRSMFPSLRSVQLMIQNIRHLNLPPVPPPPAPPVVAPQQGGNWFGNLFGAAGAPGAPAGAPAVAPPVAPPAVAPPADTTYDPNNPSINEFVRFRGMISPNLVRGYDNLLDRAQDILDDIGFANHNFGAGSQEELDEIENLRVARLGIINFINQNGGANGRQIHGTGLKKGRGRPKGSGISRKFEDKVDTNKGIQPDRRYISFGKYLINNSKLNEGTVSLRTPKGVNVIGYPSQRITPQLTSVFKKIVGGGVPSFKELTDLNENERNYLYNVSKKAEILDKLSIPSPSKDQEDKDIHDFQVMKGEILSGNDNKDLIKKFKIHMSKMVRAGSLPKKEVADIMTDLIELGF